MGNSWFQFKLFTVQQDLCAMKVGTDGVLLGAWAPLDGGLPLLDIGTGTGVVSLIAAERLSCQPDIIKAASGGSATTWITAVELDSDAALQASSNFEASPWGAHMQCICANINDFYHCNNSLEGSGPVHSPSSAVPDPRQFGTILCNPPYFRDSLRCPDGVRNAARHGDSLSFEELAACVKRLLAPEGLFSAIIPFDAIQAFVHAMALCSLYPVRRTSVCTKTGKSPKRCLVSFSCLPGPCQTDTLALFDADGHETPEYLSLVKDLYLKY